MVHGRLLQDLLRYARIAVAAVSLCALCSTQAAIGAQESSTRIVIPPLDGTAHLPHKAVLVRQLPVAFTGLSNADSVALAYTIQSESDPYRYEAVLRVMQYWPAFGWVVAYEENNEVENGGGDALRIEKVRSANGAEGVVVILEDSGAGTSTTWHVIAAVDGRFSVLDPTQIRERVLRRRGYVFMGYNGVRVHGDLVSEQLPGYSKGRARCCPNRPSIDVRTRFTGTSLKLDSVEELPDKAR